MDAASLACVPYVGIEPTGISHVIYSHASRRTRLIGLMHHLDLSH